MFVVIFYNERSYWQAWSGTPCGNINCFSWLQGVSWTVYYTLSQVCHYRIWKFVKTCVASECCHLGLVRGAKKWGAAPRWMWTGGGTGRGLTAYAQSLQLTLLSVLSAQVPVDLGVCRSFGKSPLYQVDSNPVSGEHNRIYFLKQNFPVLI